MSLQCRKKQGALEEMPLKGGWKNGKVEKNLKADTEVANFLLDD